MSSLQKLSRKSKEYALKLEQQQLAIKDYSEKTAKQMSTQKIIIGLGAAAVCGFMAQRVCSEDSKTRALARTGATYTLSSLLSGATNLSGVATILVYSQLKHFLVGKK